MPAESRLLKANVLRNLGAKVAFNYEDLKQQCDEYLAQVRQQADQLLTQAHTEAQQLRNQAQEAGTNAGRQTGLRQAEDQITVRAREIANQMLAERLQHALPALEAAATGLQVERDRWLAAWEQSAVGLSIAIAEKILRAELNKRPELALPIISEALQLAAGQPHVQVSMHPDDIELIQQSGVDITQRLAALGQGELIPDDRIGRGGCYIETQHGVIDARLETQLDRISRELTGAAHDA